jgi:N-acetyl-gamma-glutamyl-phosphate reductase
MQMQVAVLGASGYAGGELIRLLDAHPGFEPVFLGAHSQAGKSLDSVHPHLAGGDRRLDPNDPELLPDETDLVFLALPHGASADLGLELAAAGLMVVDLGSDFRLDTPERYHFAYGAPHPHPEHLADWAYGLPELFDVTGSTTVASPGCYPTAAIVGLAPILAAHLADPTRVTVSAVSGASGAGRKLAEAFLFGSVADGVVAYGVGNHRHRPEMEMALERAAGLARVNVTFTPHLVPMQRGIVATSTLPVGRSVERSELLDTLRDAYAGRPFVQVVDVPPQSRWTVGSNNVLVTAYPDPHADSVVVIAALDNLIKGAAGQAIQAANLMTGQDEGAGLPSSGWMP